MKILSFIRDPNRPIDKRMAMAAMLMNQFATPGLGSMMAGRWAAGIGQLALAIAGFLMLIVWFVVLMINYYGLTAGNDLHVNQPHWLGAGGGIVFLLSWLWSLVTSIQLLCEANRNTVPKPMPGDPPPQK